MKMDESGWKWICDGIFESEKKKDSCFSGSSTVESEERGNIPIGNLRLGDNVLTYTHGKGVHYTEVCITDKNGIMR